MLVQTRVQHSSGVLHDAPSVWHTGGCPASGGTLASADVGPQRSSRQIVPCGQSMSTWHGAASPSQAEAATTIAVTVADAMSARAIGFTFLR